MDTSSPSSDFEEKKGKQLPKLLQKKREPKKKFLVIKRKDSASTKKKRKRRKFITTPIKPHASRKRLLEFNLLNTAKSGEGIEQDPKEEVIRDAKEIPPPSNLERTNKVFAISKKSKVILQTSAKKAMNNLISIKPDPLKYISKMIFQEARRKRTILVPQDPFRIYIENMGHYSSEKAEQTKNAINYHQPAVVVVLETSAFYHKGFVTFEHPDSSQKMIIMIRRDLLHEVHIFQYKNFPIIKTFNTMFCIVHSLNNVKQHINLPQLDGRVVYLGDFNISSVAGLPESNIQEMMERADTFKFEGTWEIGYVSCGVKGGGTFIDQNERDHQALIYAADFSEPQKKLIPQAGKIRIATKKILDLVMEKPEMTRSFTQMINATKGLMVRAKPVFSKEIGTDILKPPPKVWERIKSTSSPFVNASEVKIDILDSLKSYFQRVPLYKEKIQLDQEDYKVGLYMFGYFITRNKTTLMHSNARDRNGVSYGDILNATLEKLDEIKNEDKKKQEKDIQKLFNFFWRQFKDPYYTHTRCFLIKKKPVVTEHKNLRMLSIQDSMWKFLEVLFQPVTWVCNFFAVKQIPGTFGFVAGGATFNAFTMKCPGIEQKLGKIKQGNLHPEEVTEEDLDAYLIDLEAEERKKNILKDSYDPTDFFFKDLK